MADILARNPATSPRRTNKGAEIRARIAANRAKRLRIADAMKLEAGVTEHTVHKEDFGGRAYIGTGKIYSPEGRKIVQLYTVAHECGHIFLHNSGPGYTLPGHVKELEAESYAHQAFREHGMTLPRKLSKWGSTYVASWREKDRAAKTGKRWRFSKEKGRCCHEETAPALGSSPSVVRGDRRPASRTDWSNNYSMAKKTKGEDAHSSPPHTPQRTDLERTAHC